MSELPENCNSCHYLGVEGCDHEDGEHVDTAYNSALPKACPLKTEKLDSIRFKVKYRGENLYLVVALLDGLPWEVFVEHATKGEDALQYMLAGWDCNTRFISYSLQDKPLKYVIGKLEKSSRKPDDIPGIIAGKLRMWL